MPVSTLQLLVESRLMLCQCNRAGLPVAAVSEHLCHGPLREMHCPGDRHKASILSLIALHFAHICHHSQSSSQDADFAIQIFIYHTFVLDWHS